jgi:hypothetical protein
VFFLRCLPFLQRFECKAMLCFQNVAKKKKNKLIAMLQAIQGPLKAIKKTLPIKEKH